MTKRERGVFPEVGLAKVAIYIFLLLFLLPVEFCLRQESRGSCMETGDAKSSFDTSVSHFLPLDKILHLLGPQFSHLENGKNVFLIPCMYAHVT